MTRVRRLSALATALLLAAPAAAWAQAADSVAHTARPQAADSTAPPTAAPHRAPAKAPRSIPAAQAAGAKPGTMCGICHSDTRVQSDRGIHAAEGVGCVSCHGGDPNATTVESAHRAPFRGVPRRRDIPTFCSSCHSDVSQMRPYNLPSDQFALYQTSQHGIRLGKGDERVAVCTDCHGVHEIRPPSDPKGSVFARNIPTTCGHCHGDAALMRKYNRTDNPVKDYTESVHGKAFLAGGNDAAPQCTRCHGSHGASPSGIGDVEKVCGQCHGTARTYFLAGPHKRGMDKAGESECAACHENHKTPPAKISMLGTVCLDCHDEGSKEAKLGVTFASMVKQASQEIDRADQLVAEAARIPLYVDDYKARLTDARTALMESFPVMHALDVSLVEPHTRRAGSIATEVSREIGQKLGERLWRIVGLALFWFYLLLTAMIVMRARRRAAAERDR